MSTKKNYLIDVRDTKGNFMFYESVTEEIFNNLKDSYTSYGVPFSIDKHLNETLKEYFFYLDLL